MVINNPEAESMEEFVGYAARKAPSFTKMINEAFDMMAAALSMDMDFINHEIAILIQRHYVQAGPWAEMLREG